MDKWVQAEQDYLSGMKYKDIAAKYDVALSTVKSWKTRYKWTRDSTHTKEKVRIQKEKSMHTKIAPPPEIVELDKSSLTDKQKAFALKYVQSFNATQAYISAYGVPYHTAQKNAYRLMANEGIKKEIDRLRQQVLARSHIEVTQVLADLAKEVSADLGDYVDFGGHDEYLTDEDGKPIVIHRSYVQLKSKDEVDTSLIKKVTVGKDGPVIELYDKQKAREQLLKFIQFDKTNRKIEAETKLLEAKLKLMTSDDDKLDEPIRELIKGIEDIAKGGTA